MKKVESAHRFIRSRTLCLHHCLRSLYRFLTVSLMLFVLQIPSWGQAPTGKPDTGSAEFRRFALALPGIVMEKNASSHTTLEPEPQEYTRPNWWFSPDKNPRDGIKTMLRDWWGVNDKNSLRQSISSLLAGNGHSKIFYEYMEQYIATVEGRGYSTSSSPIIEFLWRYRPYYDKKLLLAGWDLARVIGLARWGFQADYIDEEEAWQMISSTAEALADLFDSWEDFGANYCMGRTFWTSLSSDYRDMERENAQLYFSLLVPGTGAWTQAVWPSKQKAAPPRTVFETSKYIFLEEYRIQSLFTIGADMGIPSLVTYAFSNGKPADIVDFRGFTPMMYAASHKDTRILREILKNTPGGVNFQNKNHITPLIAAVTSGSAEGLRMLVEAGADIDAVNRDGWSVLQTALRNQQPEQARILMDANAEIEKPNSIGWNAISYAARYGPDDVLDAMIARKPNLNRQDSEGCTALILAVQSGSVPRCRALLDAGADPNLITTMKWTALSCAIYAPNLEVARLLLSAGADPEFVDRNGCTALGAAIWSKLPELALEILEKNVVLNTPDNKNGRTPLMLAVIGNYPIIVRKLVDLGCAVNSVDPKGWTALMLAARYDQTETVKYLAEHGAATTGCVTATGFTALHPAAAYSSPETVRILLEAGSDRKACTLKGETVIDVARSAGRTEMMGLLTEK